jgi:hypothetical protein
MAGNLTDPTRPGGSPEADRRRPWQPGPDDAATRGSWRSLNDDSLLTWIQGLPPAHESDEVLLEIVASERHFFVRQTAAMRLNDAARLRPFAADRHLGQVLARRLSREEDVEYLSTLARSSLHLEVRRAAKAQLDAIRQSLLPRTGRG